jgi:hypothetical protein
MTCTCTRCNHETALECETANCTCCSNKDHDVNVVMDEQEIEEMKTVKKFEYNSPPIDISVFLCPRNTSRRGKQHSNILFNQR